MTDPHRPHMGDEDIARLIDGRLGGVEKAKVVAHLQSCASCFEIYRDSAIRRGIWTADPSATELPAGLAEEAKRLAAQGDVSGASRPYRIPATRWWCRRPVLAGLVAAAAVVVVFASGLWVGRINQKPGGVSQDVLAPIRSAVETASMWGPLVLPGGTESLDEPGIAHRSGFVPMTESLRVSLKSLNEMFLEKDTSVETADWLAAGYIATGQIDAARDVVTHALTRDPSDPDLLTLKALVSYADGDYAQAERLLRAVLTDDPDDAVARIDLAVVLAEQGETTEVRSVLEPVLKRHAGEPIAERAEVILRGLGGQQ